MEEVIAPEEPPRLVRAVVVELPNPRDAQKLLSVLNSAYPCAEEGRTADHLKRIRKAERHAADPGAAPATAVEESQLAGPPALEVFVELYRGNRSESPHECADRKPEEEMDSCAEESHESARNTKKRVRTDSESDVPATLEAPRAAALRAMYEPLVSAVAHKCGAATAAALLFRLVDVPDRAPRQDPAQWQQWNRVWPLCVPKPTPLEKPSAALTRTATAVMQDIVLPLAVRVWKGNETPCGLLGIAAAIVDGSSTAESQPGPADGEASSSPRVIVTSEGCTTMQRCNPNACVAYTSTHSCCTHGRDCDTHGAPSLVLEHPVMYALKKLAALQAAAARSSSELAGPECGESDDAMAEAARQARIRASVPYLANALDVYVSHEPCVMCAMALVHSRVARVFFCFPNSMYGGVGSVYTVHAIPSLNHHYRAYHCVDAERGYKGPALLDCGASRPARGVDRE